MLRIICYTLFDLTPTGIKSHYRQIKFPISDATGKVLENLTDWHIARNQQRNWETILQVVSLRIQPINISLPVNFITNLGSIDPTVSGTERIWSFAFDSEVPDAFTGDNDPVGILKTDVESVPLITKLTETEILTPMIRIGKNTWFKYEKK